MTNEQRRKFRQYLQALERDYLRRNTTEHTYRPALKTLIEGLDPSVQVINEPTRIECGAPDLLIVRNNRNVGHIEAKNIGESLDYALRSPQLQNYLRALDNFILTDYLEFRWYVNGELRLTARLSSLDAHGRFPFRHENIVQVFELLMAFLQHQGCLVTTARELAERMACLSHMMRELILETYRREPQNGPLHVQWRAFREVLMPDLTPEQFADMYAQTIAYGLFAARTRTSGQNFTRHYASFYIPPTNPFLQNLFHYIAGPQLDSRIAWLVDDLSALLADANMEVILRDFGRSTRQEDPIVHFYETFLKVYDPEIREMRGVYFTPEPVVLYIVRSVDYLLREYFGRPEGLADPGVFILDPATGTGTFLFFVIKLIRQRLEERGQLGAWDGYVAEHLLPRLFGFELLMAPYAIAHLKLGIQFQELGYTFSGHRRLGIYLTNTLEEAVTRSQILFANFLVDEAEEAAHVKRDLPIEVIIGNPPWSGHSVNSSWREFVDPRTRRRRKELTWIGRLIEEYKQIEGIPLSERNPKWIQDDYVKFMRFAQWRIEQTGRGIIGMVTNHGYLDNPTFRGMRYSLMQTFTDIYVLDLHGNARKRETSPDGSPDENVFDIQQGVAICLLVKDQQRQGPAIVHHAELWGSREGKYEFLTTNDVGTIEWQELLPSSPLYLFVPQDINLEEEYRQGWSLSDIFLVHSVGIVTARDNLTIGWSPEEIYERVCHFASLSEEEARLYYHLDKDARDWKVVLAQRDLRDSGLRRELVVPILYRPFDVRYTYYTGRSRGFICRPRLQVMNHMLGGNNLCVIAPRRVEMSGSWSHILATQYIPEHVVVSSKTIDYVFPLYLYFNSGNQMTLDFGYQINLNPTFVATFSEKLNLCFIEERRGDLKQNFGPEDIFCYAYAIFHSPSYRERYSEFLRCDFPRLPLTSDRELFAVLVEKGRELVSFHLLTHPNLNRFVTRLGPPGTWTVDNICYDEQENRVYINAEQYIEGIEPEVWNFCIGGYQPLERWLKDRKGRNLVYRDLQHYQRMVVAIRETNRLMEESNDILPSWPLK
ncbi:MAG: type ISP restriction/modification enzyme [Moorellaceae bacterium]